MVVGVWIERRTDVQVYILFIYLFLMLGNSLVIFLLISRVHRWSDFTIYH